MDFLNLQTVDDIKAALATQRTVTRQVLLELDGIGERELTRISSEAEDLRIANAIRAKEVRLLERYSSRPSLREFSLPHIRGIAKDGGTFGVAAIVGEVILGNVRAIEGRFSRVHRLILMLLLREIDNPSAVETDLVDFLLRFMRIELNESAQDIVGEDRHQLLRGLMRPLVEVMILVMQEYALLESPDNKGFRLTAMGRRVMLHLFDAQKFIESVAEAHHRLQQDGHSAPKADVAN
jgi:hypothetical protein